MLIRSAQDTTQDSFYFVLSRPGHLARLLLCFTRYVDTPAVLGTISLNIRYLVSESLLYLCTISASVSTSREIEMRLSVVITV